ncbi:CRISPR system precrRNA processing endoribonuclease RAMP protein Cas6 [Dickeya oryzae]|uniref:CRISPR system precrRNA processing endoribonuclease RAMP protein Cas6 n=1 Tax=Dickeya oryzae TaxID=1240404 RepID=UPI00209706AD|nr:CRISPR system precrRNA processing endoribonuclease RAMP protein Cas6 [Dickeya oryzae]MCO7255748.1 CRISPR system precrRNA processing endoribonuclease RAMP protein Cas6 [Dickeya oryzae]
MITLPPLVTALVKRFGLCRLHLTLQLHQGGELPAFKGSMWHGWLGHMLHRHDMPFYQVLYHEHDSQQPKPYLIRPGENPQQHWQAGELISVEIVLLGDVAWQAERLAGVFCQPRPLGLGKAQLPVSVQSLATVTPFGLSPALTPGYLADWLTPFPVHVQTEAALLLDTPLRLKHQGRIVQRGTPSLSLLLEQAARRLALLAECWVDASTNWREHLKALLPVPGAHHHQGSLSRFEDWQRFSARQQELLPFGGLRGQLCYQGEITTALPWLQLGQYLHLGGKTTFGLGQYRLIG